MWSPLASSGSRTFDVHVADTSSRTAGAVSGVPLPATTTVTSSGVGIAAAMSSRIGSVDSENVNTSCCPGTAKTGGVFQSTASIGIATAGTELASVDDSVLGVSVVDGTVIDGEGFVVTLPGVATSVPDPAHAATVRTPTIEPTINIDRDPLNEPRRSFTPATVPRQHPTHWIAAEGWTGPGCWLLRQRHHRMPPNGMPPTLRVAEQDHPRTTISAG